jgi:hypothetical protein
MFFRRASLSAAFTPRAVTNGRPASSTVGFGDEPRGGDERENAVAGDRMIKTHPNLTQKQNGRSILGR